MSVEDIEQAMATVGEKVSAKASMMLDGEDSATVRDSIQHGYVTGGKYLRPTITWLVTKAIQGDEKIAIDMGVLVELGHRVSLIQDDMFDRDILRRGLPTLHEKFGLGQSLFAMNRGIGFIFSTFGDFRRTDPFMMADAAAEVGKAMYEMTTGATSELMTTTLNESEYLGIAGAKTAALFRLASHLGAMQSPNRAMRVKLASYGYNLGMAYQIADDLTDIYMTVQGGKPVGDLKEIHPTLPLIYLHQKGGEDASAVEAFCRRELSDDQVVSLARICLGSTVPRTIEKGNEFIDLAVLQLDGLYGSPSLDLLREMPVFVVNKIMQEVPDYDPIGFGFRQIEGDIFVDSDEPTSEDPDEDATSASQRSD